MIQAVIFNLDGVLISTHDCHYQAWKQLAAEQGIPFNDQIYRRMEGMKRMDSLLLLLKRAERQYSMGEMWALSVRKNDLFNDMILKLGPDSILPGTIGALTRLREMGIKYRLRLGKSTSDFERTIMRNAMWSHFAIAAFLQDHAAIKFLNESLTTDMREAAQSAEEKLAVGVLFLLKNDSASRNGIKLIENAAASGNTHANIVLAICFQNGI